MKAEMKQLEIWVMVDAAGDYAVASSEDDINQAYDDQVGGDPDGLRMVKIVVNVPLPTLIEVEATCPADEADATAAAG